LLEWIIGAARPTRGTLRRLSSRLGLPPDATGTEGEMSHAIFEVALRRLPDETRIVLRGELDMSGEDILREAVADLDCANGERVVLDLGDLRFIDSTGVRVVLEERQRLLDAGCCLAIRLGAGAPRRVFSLLGLEELLEESDDLTTAEGDGS
jgi:anti-anti-sigma factor